MANFIERNQQRKEKRVLMNLYLRDCPRAEECPHEFVEVSTRLRPSFLCCREFGLLHLSRTKKRRPLLLSYRSYVKPLARQSKWDSNTRDAGPIDQIIRDLTPHLYPLNGRQDAKADSRAGSAGKVNYLLYYSITQRSSLRKSHLLGWKNGQRRP